MTQLWTLVYFQKNYKANRNLRIRIGCGEERIRKMLRFLKEDPLMIVIREKPRGSFFGDAADDNPYKPDGSSAHKDCPPDQGPHISSGQQTR